METNSPQSIYQFNATRLNGEECNLAQYQGKVLLIVNVASRCGFTPQYQSLQKLYTTYQPHGFEILAFPCNQFRQQEPGSAEEIAQFCEANYQITFPIFAKIKVNGKETHPLYQWLKQQKKGLGASKSIKWNFTKFLVDRNGDVSRRFAPTTKPDAIEKWIKALL